VTALPIKPTDEQISEWLATAAFETGRYEKIRLAHQAGVEAERARVAAEATVEWGTQRIDGSFPPVVASSKADAQGIVDTVKITPRRLMRRTAIVGPWEVAK
jgi:hypothetical protein